MVLCLSVGSFKGGETAKKVGMRSKNSAPRYSGTSSNWEKGGTAISKKVNKLYHSLNVGLTNSMTDTILLGEASILYSKI